MYNEILEKFALPNVDNEIASCIENESIRQKSNINLIASENLTSQAVMEATGSCLTNKYAEGYVGKRYYEGCKFIDEVEAIAIKRAKQLFNAEYANVQPHSGSSANLAVYLALCNHGDSILGMSLSSGGHLTHGASFNFSGKWFNALAYDVDPITHLLDYDLIEDMAKKHKPKILLAGGSAYPRYIDFARLRSIADMHGAILWIDMAHFAGLVAAGLFPNPLPYADVVTSTTHKTLRGPRGGIILSNNLDLERKLNSAVFPGSQGGPLMHVIAAKAVCFKECMSANFHLYIRQVIDNASQMAKLFINSGYKVLTNGTDTHLLLIDTKSSIGLNGQEAADMCMQAGIIMNKNHIPHDTSNQVSGVRIGTPFFTSQGAGAQEIDLVTQCIMQIWKNQDIETSRKQVNNIMNKLI